MRESEAFRSADVARCRSRLYKLLSLVYQYPTMDFHVSLASGEYPELLLDALEPIPHLGELVREHGEYVQEGSQAVGREAFCDVEATYNEIFAVGAPDPPCPPYEGLTRTDAGRTEIMLEVSRFYRHFGLRTTDDEVLKDLPDHLAAELEFMHFLAFKEGQASHLSDLFHARGYVLAQLDFLERHLNMWLPAFSRKVALASGSGFYAATTLLAAEVVRREAVQAATLLAEFESSSVHRDFLAP